MQYLKIKHLTAYEYPTEVTFLPHKLLLRPREGHYVRIKDSHLSIKPAHQVRWHCDVHDNSVAVVRFTEPGRQLLISSEIFIENHDNSPLDFLIAQDAVSFPFQDHAEDGPG